MEKLFVRYKGKKYHFETPSGWKVLTFATFQDHSGEKDVEKLTRQALKHPIGTVPLKECLSSSDTVSIIIEDLTRASPKKRVLKALLEVLNEAGVEKGNISIIISLGTHRALSDKELRDNYGEDVVTEYTVLNHDCLAPDLVPVAKLKTGAVVKINKKVHDATYKIGIGSIFPHPMNGFEAEATVETAAIEDAVIIEPLRDIPAIEPEEDEDDPDKKLKKKGKRKDRTLVLDEASGQVVAKKQRKSGRAKDLFALDDDELDLDLDL